MCHWYENKHMPPSMRDGTGAVPLRPEESPYSQGQAPTQPLTVRNRDAGCSFSHATLRSAEDSFTPAA